MRARHRDAFAAQTNGTHLDVKLQMKTFALVALLFSTPLVMGRPSPDSPVTLLVVPEFEGFEGINSIAAIGTGAGGDVTTYELFRTGGTDPATATIIESSGGYTLIDAPVFTDHFNSVTTVLRTDVLPGACAFIGGNQASCAVGGATQLGGTTLALSALTTFGAGSSPASPTSTGSGTASSLDPSRTTSSADTSSTSKSNAGDVRYGKGYGAVVLLSVIAAFLVVS
ncbi:hypothetical protein MVEN_01656500 [Mycena venus]|uniref:Uncharacterized protein n=1 Tax=Mycena venus TaxID=2733690 RepID=A0A8H6XQK1_9AGAR|nr:hypothetical protein MVEN_01656500 [Mycena venus]